MLLIAWACASGVPSAAEEMPVTAEEALDCVINPSVVADLGSGVPGIIDRVLVDRADHVDAGQVVAELESGVELASRDLARVRAEKDTEIELRRVNAAFGQRQNARSEDLFARKVISTNDMDERKTEARLAAIQLRQALDNKEIAQLELERAEQVVKRRAITSPISGVVMERFKTMGEYVDEQPVLRVAQLDPLHVEVFVPVQRLGEIRPGMQASVWSDAVADQHWQARVSRVDRVADVASGTYGVRLVLPNPDYRVPAGLRCRLSFSAADPVSVVEDTATASVPITTAAEVVEDRMSAPEGVPLAPGPSAMPPDGSAPEADVSTTIDTVAETTEVALPPAPTTADSTSAATVEEPPVPDASAVVAPAASAISPLPAASTCLRSGPYPSRTVAGRVARELRAQGLQVDIAAYEDKELRGHRVVSAWLPDLNAVDTYVAKLKAAGVTDWFVSPRRQVPLRVNLGFYKDATIARQRVNDLLAKGFDADVTAWAQTVKRYALDISGTTDEHIAQQLSDLPTAASATAGGCERLASH